MGRAAAGHNRSHIPVRELLNTNDADNSWLCFTSEEVAQQRGN